jgi:hypothetical protein
MNLTIVLIAFVPTLFAICACMLSSQISREEEAVQLKQHI